MKKLARILGIVVGIGAVVWAMRDRFISLTVPREPEPPAFRPPPVRPPTAAPRQRAGSGTVDDLTEVKGVGPVYARRLAEQGITTFAALAALSEDELADALGSNLGKIPEILADALRLAGEA